MDIANMPNLPGSTALIDNPVFKVRGRRYSRLCMIGSVQRTVKTVEFWAPASSVRDHVHSSNPKFVFTTIADQVGQFCRPFQEQLTRTYTMDPGLKYSSVSNQLENLIVKPLGAVRDNVPPCVVVLDAIDECKDENATSLILSSLSRYIGLLEPLKFLVTSRLEPK